MKKSTYYLILGLLVAVIVVGGGMLWLQRDSAPQETQPTEIEMPTETTEATEPVELAPDFTVEDNDGNPVKLSDFRGTPVVLNFWASWCGPCKSEMPEFEEAYHTYGDRVQFMMVDLVSGRSETKEMGQAVIAENGYTFPVFFDVNQEASAVYGLSAIPMTCFISAEGEIVMQQVGMLSAEGLEEGIQAILTE